MEKIGLVTNDPHLRKELTEWLSEIPVEFEFIDLGPSAAAEPAALAALAVVPLAAEDTIKTEEKKFRFVVYDSRFPVPLSKLRDDLKMGDVPWLAIGAEEHAQNPHAVQIHGADDLILMPLDRLVLLQKAEYILAAGAAVTPSFLFLAKADLPIELAKQVHVTHLSETGCTIQSMRPVARGVEGTLVCKLFGEGALERVEIRAIDSVPIFDSSLASLPGGAATSGGNFEVQLRFFGLKHRQLQNLRRWMASHLPEGHRPPDIKRSDGEPKSILHVALITPQQALGSLLTSSLEQLAKIELDGFGGFQRFHAALLKRGPAAATTADETLAAPAFIPWSQHFVGPKTLEDAAPMIPRSPMIVHLRVPTDVVPGAFEKIAPALKPGERLFSLPGPIWAQDVAPLLKFFSPADRGAFEEAIHWTTSNSTVTQKPETSLTLEVCTSATQRQRLVFKISLSEAAIPLRSALLKLQISEAPEAAAAPASAAGQKPCEAIMVDASLLSFDVQPKLAALAEWLEKFDIRNAFGNRPPIIVFNAAEEKIQTQEFRGTAVRQLAYEFADRRFQAEMFISLSRPELWTSPQLSVAGLKTDLKAFLGRPAKASAVSEVSLTVSDRTPLKKGTELLVMSPIWSQAPEGLWARLRAVVAKDGTYENEFVFFGVSDLVQKEIRKFARADYIKKKAQGQG